jgi:ribosomal protein S18 acetylase RimI-like enzyme
VTAEAELARRHAAAQRAAYRLFAAASPDGSTVELEGGVMASIVPAVPDRSVFNAVLYDRPEPLLAALDELAARYDAAGVRAWTVWTHPGDTAAAEALRAAGHAHDAQPMLMGAGLAELDLGARAELSADEGDWGALAACNDAAYGLPAGTFATALAGIRDPAARAYVVSEGGRPVAAAGTVLHEGDAEVIFVATLPEARGRGLASELMRHALREARADGAETTTLEATALGEPVYARMGYRSLGRLGMWERRKA